MREKLIKLIDRWYLIPFVFLISAALAWGVTHFFPPQHQGIIEVYVGIDINRVFDVSSMATYARSEPFNIDDYKNWQLSQLDAIARSEQVAEDTLAELRERDSYWDSIDVVEFQGMQDLDWWDVGTWRLKISHADPDRAAQAAQVWSSFFVRRVSTLIAQAESSFELDAELRAVENQQTQLEAKIAQVDTVLEELDQLSADLEGLNPDQPLRDVKRWQLWGWAASSAEFTPLWNRTLDTFPEDQSPTSQYRNWMKELGSVLGTQRDLYQSSLASLEEKEGQLTQRYLEEIRKSNGLSPNLSVEVASSKAKTASIYPGPVIALLGGSLGLLIYLFVFLWITEIQGGE